ncbi:unnamed protein product [Closterium sp. NIES-53]
MLENPLWCTCLLICLILTLPPSLPPGINTRQAGKELRLFCSVLARATKEERSFHSRLSAILKTPDWRESYPNLVQLWVAVAVIPLSTVECERGFTRQNVIKTWRRGGIKDARLGDLMCLSLMQYEPNYDEVVEIWQSYRKRKPFSNAPICTPTPAVTTAVASLSFTLDSGTSLYFFREHTTVTPLSAPVLVALADPTLGPAVAHSSTTLPCLAVPSGFLTGLYIPSFSRNLVGVGYLQDREITVTCPAHGRTTICTDASTGALLPTFTREPHSGLFVLHTTSPEVAASGQVTASPQVDVFSQVVVSGPVGVSGLVAASCSCRSLSHLTVLWHHRLGHPSIPRLRSMASQRLVSGLPRVFASLPPSPAPPCTPCVAGRLCATPHSSSLRPATAPFQTLHLDAWGPAPTQGPEKEC